jgi:NAD(P)-dependent dehydrogenase (short-subunit alcohol dehydrogenase family)
VCANTIRPGVVETSFHDRLGRDMNKRKKMIPMKRFIKADEISAMIYQICENGDSITGQTITIAGGE